MTTRDAIAREIKMWRRVARRDWSEGQSASFAKGAIHGLRELARQMLYNERITILPAGIRALDATRERVS